MTKLITRVNTVVLIFSLILASGQTSAQEPKSRKDTFNWRFSHFIPANHSVAKAFAHWAKSLEQATENQLKINIYPSGQLGSGTDHYDMIRTRVAHLGWFVPGYEQGRFPIFSLLETPFLINDAVGGAESFHHWYAPFSAIEMTPVFPCLMTASPPGKLSFSQPAPARPVEAEGKRFRVSTATEGRYVRSVGGVTMNIPLGEVRHALERGMIDALRFDFYSLKAMKLDHLLVHHLDMSFASAPAIVGINRLALAELPAELQTTVKKFCTAEWSGKMVAAWQQLNEEASRVIRSDKSHHFQQVSAADLNEWLEHTKPLIDEWKLLAARKGLKRPQQALENLQKILKENNAHFTLVKPAPDQLSLHHE